MKYSNQDRSLHDVVDIFLLPPLLDLDQHLLSCLQIPFPSPKKPVKREANQ